MKGTKRNTKEHIGTQWKTFFFLEIQHQQLSTLINTYQNLTKPNAKTQKYNRIQKTTNSQKFTKIHIIR